MSALNFISRIKNLGENNFSPSKTFKYEKEAIAAGVLLFSNYTHAAIVFLPAMIGLAIYLNSSWIFESEFISITQIQEFQTTTLITMLEIFKVTSLFLIGYFGVLKFQNHKKSGNYGYWLSMGMDRLTFYNYMVAGFTMNGVLSALILLVHILLIERFYIPIIDILVLFLLLASSLFLLTSVFFFISESVDNSEIAFFTVALIYIISIFFSDLGNPLNVILNAELFFSADNRWLLFVSQLGLAGLFQYLGWRSHREIDILLGG